MTSSIQKQTILKSVWSNKATRELPLLSRTRAPIMAVQNEIDGITLEGFFLLRHWNPILHLQIKIHTGQSDRCYTISDLNSLTFLQTLRKSTEFNPKNLQAAIKCDYIFRFICYAVINIKQTSLIGTIMSKCLLNWIWALLIHCAMLHIPYIHVPVCNWRNDMLWRKLVALIKHTHS